MAMVDAGGRLLDEFKLEKDKDKLYPVAMIGFTDELYPSVKKALENADVKRKMLNAFTDYAKLAGEGRCLSKFDFMCKDVIDCIVEYPKVIIENHFSKDMNAMRKDLEKLGQLKLPFPKITLIAGERTNQDPNFVGNMPTLTTQDVAEQDGSVNLIYSCFLVQEGDSVSVNAVFSKPNEIGKYYYIATAILKIEDGELLTFDTYNYNDAELVENDTLGTLAAFSLVAIHMLTISGGDMYVSAPTPDEVAVNRKRVSKGKKPLVEFRLITVDTKKKDTEVVMHHGTHASPRQHWRRGHWRTAPKSGKQVWIDPSLVGDEKNGKIIKDYAVGHYEERRA
jgi:hypothetical protein